MAKIVGNIVGLPSPRSDWDQTDEAKADFIKNKPTKLSQFENDIGAGGGGGGDVDLSKYVTWGKFEERITPLENNVADVIEDLGDIDTALDAILAIQGTIVGGGN